MGDFILFGDALTAMSAQIQGARLPSRLGVSVLYHGAKNL